ncbi:MAG: serpin family protein, partial [Firmicutes bacterium]|nr:serpin family protein [Bacillota bacterium]
MLILTLFLPLAAGCGPTGGPAYAEPAEHVDSRLVEANTRFALDLFQTLRKETPDVNLFISPASVSLALAMTYNGADGDTASAMADVLGFGEMELE